ncbi:MAG: phage tail protein [Acinetobacter sp.]|nr:phage tail protein [Acinetobacter sp.]
MAATYKGLLTNNGKALIASATLNNKINYSHIAVGDGNGSVPNPLETRTALVNEKARIALNVVEINPNNTNQIICEAIIPSNLGGFYIRELGLYAGATMVVNASYPPTYKPLADEGGAREIAIKLVINIQNAEVIALYLDDSLIYATRAWVDTNYIRRNELVDNLTTDDEEKPVSAKQAKNLQDSKLDKTANAVSSSKLETARTVSFSGAATGSFTYDGSGNSSALLTLANSGVLAGTYGSPLKIPVITVNQKGLVTVVAEQNIPVGLEKNQLMKAGNARLTSSASLEQFLNNYHGLSVPFFENGAAGLFGPYSAGLVSSYDGGGTFAIGASVLDGRVYGVAAPENILAEAMRFEFYTTRSVQFNGNAISASKLQNPRTVFGQTFDGTGDVGGTITASTGLVQASAYHFIDMGRNGLDRMNFYNFGATFNFIDSQNGNVVARITQNGIDCNAASASKLKTPRKINGVDFDGTTDIDLPLIGIGQDWKDLAALRVENTTYINSSNRTITIFFGGARQGAPPTEFYVNGEIFAQFGGGYEPDEVYFSIPIPPNGSYKYVNKPQMLFYIKELS